MPELLLELFSEEIPARMQQRAAQDLRSLVTGALVERGLVYEGAEAHAAPRRLVLSVVGLPMRTTDTREERKGPRLDAPENAIRGFLKSTGMNLADCQVVEDKKGKFYVAVISRKGRPAADLVAEIIPHVIKSFPWPKSMRWGSSPLRWVRPLQSILCTFDGETVPFELDGLRSGNITRGHRFMAPQAFAARRFDDYAASLARAKVMISASERAQSIVTEARNLAFARGLELIEDDALLNEVAGLVEWPVILMGDFERAFLALPPEVIATTLKAHQRCFALKDARTGALASKYLLVANLSAKDGGREIIAGNNRVIAARLADAKFFWDQGQKIPLDKRLPELGKIMFHAGMGTQGERATRLEETATANAAVTYSTTYNLNDLEYRNLSGRAGRLAKADLVTELVGELPELQGVIGRYYAQKAEPPEVAQALEEHYRPTGPEDKIPTAPVSVIVGITDRIDLLIGLWAIGKKPTSSGDPYGLRRAALGVIRLIIENNLRMPLLQAFERSLSSYRKQRGATFGTEFDPLDLLSFLADRLKVYLRERGARHDLIDAVFSVGGQDDLLMLVKRVEALANFLDTDDGRNLLAGVKRAVNIVRKEETKDNRKYSGEVRAELLSDPLEKHLWASLQATIADAEDHIKQEDFESAMESYSTLRSAVDSFFERVMVNVNDAPIRENRLNLLNQIRVATLKIADFSRIEG